MKEWLLFDRVTLHASDVTPWNEERASSVEADLADSRLPIGNGTLVTTGIAAQSIAIKLFPQRGVRFANTSVSRQNIAQGGHKHILRPREI